MVGGGGGGTPMYVRGLITRCVNKPLKNFYQIIALMFFLFLPGNTQFQRIWRKWMPYNVVWTINVLNEDEFDVQNYLYQGGVMDNSAARSACFILYNSRI